jgi:PHD/YefM family antitoxin component YafN of YafNO toxin-antitoxin module
MPAIYPSTALKNEQRAIKAIADNEVVYITENGRGKYLFMSQEVHDREIAEAVEEALYEARMAEALRASRADYEAGRYYTSREELKAAVQQKRAANNA